MDKKTYTIFNDLVVKDSAGARYIIKQQHGYKQNAYCLRCIALTYKDEAMFKTETEMRRRFINRKLQLAKKYIDMAFLLAPDCRDVLYIKGVIYNAMGDTYAAIDCYIRVLEIEENLDKEYNCSESDLPFVQMILNDSRFQLYRLFHDLDSMELSNDFLKEYKKYLRKGVNTIYWPLKKFLM
jgi:tetratricopeptide (TPR) repeat protein